MSGAMDQVLVPSLLCLFTGGPRCVGELRRECAANGRRGQLDSLHSVASGGHGTCYVERSCSTGWIVLQRTDRVLTIIR